MGFEPTTTCLGSKDSTTELRPPLSKIRHLTSSRLLVQLARCHYRVNVRGLLGSGCVVGH